jgi:uncharacterized protein (TIGR03437 family)
VTTFLLCGQTASAQTAASMVVVAGNGQITCQACQRSLAKFFSPLVVQVLDANGQPVTNKQVNWSIVSSQGATPSVGAQSLTDGNGFASTFFSQAYQPGSAAQGFLQTTIQATADSATATFVETQALVDANNNLFQFVYANVSSPAIGTTFSGTAGAPASTPVAVSVNSFGGGPVANASVRLLNANVDPTTFQINGPSASCATGPGADIGSVLTDSTGTAICNVVFGPISGTGSFTVLVGGLDPSQSSLLNLAAPIAYFQSGAFPITVKAGVPGQMQISSGNNQTVNAGQTTQPLVVKVLDSAGLNPIANQTVNFTVSPAGAATLNPASGTTNSSGVASTVATLSPNAVGAISVKAALTGSLSNISQTFTITTAVQVTGLQKVSGDAQSSPAGQAFASPLVVQVNISTGQAAPGQLVNFSISGPGTLSASSATTDSTGKAQVNVTAGSTPGTITVTASLGSFNQSFTLTVIPPGPNLSSGRIVNGADFQVNSISPCSMASMQATGLAPTLQGTLVAGVPVGPLPYTLGGDKVTVNNTPAPIFSLSHMNAQEQITFQIPCDATPGSNIPLTVNVGGGSATTNITILPGSPGIYSTTMSDGVNRAVLARPDGSWVSLQNPARRGEIITVYVTGLGPVSPAVGTDSIAVPGTDSLVTGQVIVGVNNAGARLIKARLAPSLIGVYEVAFQVPSDAPTGNDVVLSVAINVPGDPTTRFSGGSKIPIQ